MKQILPLVALAFSLQLPFGAALSQDQKSAIAPDGAIDGPPAEAVAPAPNAKARKKPSTQGKTRPVNPEVKAFAFSNRDRTSRPLVVRGGPTDSKLNTQLQEDLLVMSRILEKSVADFREDHEEVAGIRIELLAAGKNVRALYLDDYGVIFTLSVNFPLRAELKQEDQDDRGDKTVNEEWTEARNELFGDRRPNRAEKTNRKEIDPHQLDEFRSALIDAMRNASHIRNLRNGDWITVAVRGRGNDDDIERRLDVYLNNAGPGREAIMTPLPAGGDERAGESSTMVLRIKKNDLDAIGKQPHSLDEFKKKVSVLLY